MTPDKASDVNDNASNEIEKEDIGETGTITSPFSPGDISLSTPPMNLGDLLDMITAGWINFGTKYQRCQNLWDDKKQSRLIESILLGLRLPAFYFEEISRRQWNIIDGLQRCCAIRNFCVDETLVLRDLEFLGEQFDKKKYSAFSFSTKRDFRMLPITVNILEKGTPDNVKYILFQRLNMGGLTLTPQEIRTAMFQGKVIDLLDKMATSEEFLKATRGKIPTRRQEDRDFVSRFIAFHTQNYKDYKTTLEQFINKAMENLAKATEETFAKITADFAKAMNAAYEIFGDRAFRRCQEPRPEKMPPLNKALFEVVAVTFAKLDDDSIKSLIERKELLNEHLWSLMKDESAREAFSRATGMPQCVYRRFSSFEQAVKNTIDNIPAAFVPLDSKTPEDDSR